MLVPVNMDKGKSTLYQAINILQKVSVLCRTFMAQNGNLFCNSDVKFLFHPLLLMDKFISLLTDNIVTFSTVCIVLNKS